MNSLQADGLYHQIKDATGYKKTLARFDQKFEPGTFYAIGGPSGSGKTTLLALLSLTVEPSAGSIFWNAQNLCELSAVDRVAWRRQNMGLIFQHSRLISVMNVKDHIHYVAGMRNSPEAVDEGFRLLDELGMNDKHASLPAQLSGGEKQRLAIAQALSARPAIILADEPTASLDKDNAIIVANLLRDFSIKSGGIVVCVTHDRNVSDLSDHFINLKNP
jgi:putative ABC transport system ATP-binding protein